MNSNQQILDFLEANGADSQLIDRIRGFAMECQINVGPGTDGEPVHGTKKFTDGLNTWGPSRIASSEYRLNPLSLSNAERVGFTGYDFEGRASRFVGYDFDANDHAKGHTKETMDEIIEAASTIPYVEIRRSTGGVGLHLYVDLKYLVPTVSREEHRALAFRILDQMSSEAGFDFTESLDCAGGVLWAWTNKPTDTSFELIKAAEHPLDLLELTSLPATTSTASTGIEQFAELLKPPTVHLSDSHKRVIDVLSQLCSCVNWVEDKNLLQVHTWALQECGLDTTFRTSSEGRDLSTANAFMYPLPAGNWKVVRFGTPDECSGWETGKHTQRLFQPVLEQEPEEKYRCLRNENGEPAGYAAKVNGRWDTKKVPAIKTMLVSDGYQRSDLDLFLGNLEKDPYTLDHTPFGAEYPEPKVWNRNKYFRIEAVQGEHPIIDSMLSHLGSDIDNRIDDRCRALGIGAGGDWILMFLKIIVQRPRTRLPWFSLYSSTQDEAGKSKLSELWQLMFTESCFLLKESQQNNNGWNDEEQGVPLMILDETTIPGLDQSQLNRRLDARTMPIAKRGTTKFQVPNYLHYVQMTNDLDQIPAFSGDTRLMALEVPPVAEKDVLFLDKIEAEAPAFLWTLLNGDLPPESMKQGRLFLPVIDTDIKAAAINGKHTPGQIAEHLARNIRSFARSRNLERISSADLHQMAKAGMSLRKFEAFIKTPTFETALTNQELTLTAKPKGMLSQSRRKITAYTVRCTDIEATTQKQEAQ